MGKDYALGKLSKIKASHSEKSNGQKWLHSEHNCSGHFDVSRHDSGAFAGNLVINGWWRVGEYSNYSYNVMLSANHPSLVGIYARDVLPIVARVPRHMYHNMQMLKSLKWWLEYHRELIEEIGCWHHAQAVLNRPLKG